MHQAWQDKSIYREILEEVGLYTWRQCTEDKGLLLEFGGEGPIHREPGRGSGWRDLVVLGARLRPIELT